MKNVKQSQKGFAHIELAILMALIIVIGAIGYSVYKKSQDTKAVAKLAVVAKTPAKSPTAVGYSDYAPKNVKPTTEQDCNGKPHPAIYSSSTEKLAFDIPPGDISDLHCDADPAVAAADSLTVVSIGPCVTFAVELC